MGRDRGQSIMPTRDPADQSPAPADESATGAPDCRRSIYTVGLGDVVSVGS